MVSYRSTKGASKARRDHINTEIRRMRALLPISEEEKERLSYLHTMSAICIYIRKSVFYQELQSDVGESSLFPYEDFLPALPGFIVAMTGEGKLIYVSENVSTYLGYSMVDLLQGDSFYDMVESADLEAAKNHLQTDSSSETERIFICRMHTSKAFRLRHGSSNSILIRGRFQTVPGSAPSCTSSRRVFVALCSPTVNRLQDIDSHCFMPQFQSLHQPDMTFTDIPDSLPPLLGYCREEMISQSWYSLLHPADISFVAVQHKRLLLQDEDTPVEMVLRMQCKDFSWAWLYVVAVKDSGRQSVCCINYIISQVEATFLIQQIHAQVNSRSSDFQHISSNHCGNSTSVADGTRRHSDDTAKNLKRHMEESNLTEEPVNKASRMSNSSTYMYYMFNRVSGSSPPTVQGDCPVLPSTPPYSPVSHCSPSLQEETNSSSFPSTDFLLDSYRFPQDLLLTPESSPSYYPAHDQAVFPVESGHLPASGPFPALVDNNYRLDSLSIESMLSPPAGSSPSYNFSSCPGDVQLVPDIQPVKDICGGESDYSFHLEDFSIPQSILGVSSYMEPQGLLTPEPSPNAESTFQYNAKEQAEISILAQQISSLATNFDMYQSMSGLGDNLDSPSNRSVSPLSQETQHPPFSWPRPSAPEPKAVLDEGVIDSILKDLDMVPDIESNPCPSSCSNSEPPSTMDACGLQSNHSLPDVHTTDPSVLLHLVLDNHLSQNHPSIDIHPALDSCITSSTCNGSDSELHQLSQYLHSSLQQGKYVVTVPLHSHSPLKLDHHVIMS
ncbi:NPAS4 protein, partial [Amia calva]|nr:NPAS4 protein [Amia calva]